MNIEVLLIMNGVFLAFILFIMLIVMALKPNEQKKSKKVGSDIKKIKDQINGK